VAKQKTLDTGVINWIERARDLKKLAPRPKRLGLKERLSLQRKKKERWWYVAASYVYLTERLGYAVEEVDAPILGYDLIAVSREETLFVFVCVKDWPDAETMRLLNLVPRPLSSRFVIHRWNVGGATAPDVRTI
jgi:hypothetical protein